MDMQLLWEAISSLFEASLSLCTQRAPGKPIFYAMILGEYCVGLEVFCMEACMRNCDDFKRMFLRIRYAMFRDRPTRPTNARFVLRVIIQVMHVYK